MGETRLCTILRNGIQRLEHRHSLWRDRYYAERRRPTVQRKNKYVFSGYSCKRPFPEKLPSRIGSCFRFRSRARAPRQVRAVLTLSDAQPGSTHSRKCTVRRGIDHDASAYFPLTSPNFLTCGCSQDTPEEAPKTSPSNYPEPTRPSRSWCTPEAKRWTLYR